MARAIVDKACERLGLSDLVDGKSDREVHGLWTQFVGEHATLLHLRMHLHRVLPGLEVDAILSHAEQRELWACLQTWGLRFK